MCFLSWLKIYGENNEQWVYDSRWDTYCLVYFALRSNFSSLSFVRHHNHYHLPIPPCHFAIKLNLFVVPMLLHDCTISNWDGLDYSSFSFGHLSAFPYMFPHLSWVSFFFYQFLFYCISVSISIFIFLSLIMKIDPTPFLSPHPCIGIQSSC